jgi:hypothetical protein
MEAIERLVTEVVDPDPNVRNKAAETLLEAKSDWVSGISRKIDTLAERSDRAGMKKLLEKTREKLPGTDYFEAVLSAA